MRNDQRQKGIRPLNPFLTMLRILTDWKEDIGREKFLLFTKGIVFVTIEVENLEI
ncbi:MAG: hypothetical protein ACUVUG_01410 [Candidatus Aminicenantia bacterium]